jgi:hypothetical protein
MKKIRAPSVKTAEKVLRTYIKFSQDINAPKPVEILPSTIVDAMEEFASVYTKKAVKVGMIGGMEFAIRILQIHKDSLNKQLYGDKKKE